MGNSESSQVPSKEKDKSRERETSSSRTTSSGSSKPLSHVKNVNPRQSGTHHAQPSTSTSTTTAHAASITAHTRPRSTTASSSKTVPDTMGQSESKVESKRPPSRSATLPTHPTEPEKAAQPIDVPQPAGHDGGNETVNPHTPTITQTSPMGLQPNFSRPPRMPIPMRDPEPSSPLLEAVDGAALPESNDILGTHPSLLSATTLDEDDEGADIEHFAAHTNPLAQQVPTTLTWRGDAEAVYVTGTFADWNKKFKMQSHEDGVFQATMPLTTGTHHITFLADGESSVSQTLPTTVDFANALVNYIEVTAPSPGTQEKEQQPAEPIPIPGTSTAIRDHAIGAEAVRPPARGAETVDVLPVIQGETIVPLPTGPTSAPRQTPHPPPSRSHPNQQSSQAQPAASKPSKPLKPRPKYTTAIPDLLQHLDLYSNPDDQRYVRASRAIQHLPPPPSLPMFMSKSILNATTPQKDDASVLTMPNHTVLNHLATSSIRNGVLATSGTTRYKRKFLTTIMYKPTLDH